MKLNTHDTRKYRKPNIQLSTIIEKYTGIERTIACVCSSAWLSGDANTKRLLNGDIRTIVDDGVTSDRKNAANPEPEGEEYRHNCSKGK